MGRKPRKYYIDGHFYTVEELAEEVGVSKRAMDQRIRKWYGTMSQKLITYPEVIDKTPKNIKPLVCIHRCSVCKLDYCIAEHPEEKEDEEKQNKGLYRHYGFIHIDDAPYRRHHWGESECKQ